MFTKRSITTLCLMASFGAASVGAWLAPDEAAAGNFCDEVKNATAKQMCNKGYKDREGKQQKIKDKGSMKKAMQSWQSEARKKNKTFSDGAEVKCITCHTEKDGSGDLKGDAIKKYFSDFADWSGALK